MKEEKKIEKKEEPAKEKTKLNLNRAHVAMLSVSATILVFILAFSCYGCSYQPATPPSLEEAKLSFERLYNSTWVLDTAEGKHALEEMDGMVIEQLVIDPKKEQSNSVNAKMILEDYPPLAVELVYQEGVGFTIRTGNFVYGVKLIYSSSKDGKNETLTMIGNESNKHCYYLKQ